MMEYKITALRAQKRNPERVNVYLDGEFAFGLARIVAAWLEVGQQLSAEKIDSLQAQDQIEVGLQHAIKYLGYRPRSVDEVRRNLVKNEYPAAAIEEILSRLQRNGLLDDRSFARRWVENRLEFRPRGRRALQYELRKAGVAETIIQETLDEILTDEDRLAYEAARKYARKLKTDERRVFVQKLFAYLGRRGFSYDTASGVVERIWQEDQNRSRIAEDNGFENEVD